MKKYIFINRYFYPDKSATSQILEDLLHNISADIAGEVYVLTSRFTYENDGPMKQADEVRGVHIRRIWTSNFGRKNLRGRAIDYLTFYFSALINLSVLMKKGDVVIAKTDPPVISFVAYLVVKIKGGYLINWIQDLFPEVAGALGVIKKNSLLYRFIKNIKNISLKSASMNVAIGEKMADHLICQGVSADKIEVIHNWNVNIHPEYIPKDKNEFITDWGLKGKFVVGYSGNFGRAHEYGSVKKLIEHFKNNREIVFLFIGGGKYYNDLRVLSELNSYSNVIFKPYQSKSKLNESLSVADVHLISLKPELEGLIVPSKFYGLTSIGAPMIFIGDDDGQIGSVLLENNCGFVVDANNSDELILTVEKLLFGKKDVIEISKKVKKMHDLTFKPEVSYSKWKKILLSDFYEK